VRKWCDSHAGNIAYMVPEWSDILGEIILLIANKAP